MKTIQTLSEKLDEGKILKYCYPEIDYTNFDPLMFSMNAVKATFEEVEDVLINYDDFIVNAKNNEADKLIRHSRIKDFDSEAIKSFYTKTFKLNEIECPLDLLLFLTVPTLAFHPFYLFHLRLLFLHYKPLLRL